MAETELLPCHCGGKAEYEGLYVYCTQCGVRAPDEPDEAEAIAAWNRRPPAVAELVHALHGTVGALATGRHIDLAIKVAREALAKYAAKQEKNHGNPIACPTCRQWPCRCASQSAYEAALRIDNAGDSPASYDLRALEADAYIVAAAYLAIMDRKEKDHG